MSLKSETTTLRICGNCVHATRELEPNEIRVLTRTVHFNQRYLTNLVLARRYAKPLRDDEMLCRKENIEVSLLEEACAFWRPRHPY